MAIAAEAPFARATEICHERGFTPLIVIMLITMLVILAPANCVEKTRRHLSKNGVSEDCEMEYSHI